MYDLSYNLYSELKIHVYYTKSLLEDGVILYYKLGVSVKFCINTLNLLVSIVCHYRVRCIIFVNKVSIIISNEMN